MDVSGSLAPFGSRTSRRSFPALNHLSLAPLSSHFPIDDADSYEDQLRSSYIQGKSAPTTPGILNRSSGHGHSSHHRNSNRRKKHVYDYDSYFHPDGSLVGRDSIPKAKSSSALMYSHGGPHVSTSAGNFRHGNAAYSRQTGAFLGTNDEWYHRAGLAIASETQESKGQAWLAHRESSTSLVQKEDDEYAAAVAAGEIPDSTSGHYYHQNQAYARRGSSSDNDGVMSPLTPGYYSRAQSRTSSKKNSRRGSRAGSKVGFLTPLESKFPNSEEYFDAALMEPDFINPESTTTTEDLAAEEEIAQLARVQGFGLGGIVDRLVGLSLFNVDEDSENEERERQAMTAEEALKTKQAQLKRRRDELARADAEDAAADAARRHVVIQPPRQDEAANGWNDASWLLGVASKVAF